MPAYFRKTYESVNHLQPNINIDILQTVLHKFPKVLSR